jgi:hypothetical protein
VIPQAGDFGRISDKTRGRVGFVEPMRWLLVNDCERMYPKQLTVGLESIPNGLAMNSGCGGERRVGNLFGTKVCLFRVAEPFVVLTNTSAMFCVLSDTSCPRGSTSSSSPTHATVESIGVQCCTLVAVDVRPAMIFPRALAALQGFSRHPSTRSTSSDVRGEARYGTVVWVYGIVGNPMASGLSCARLPLTGPAHREHMASNEKYFSRSFPTTFSNTF